MSKEKDMFRADCSKDFDLPTCPHCGRKVYVEKGYRANHYCKGGKMQLRTEYCGTPEEAVELYLNGKYEYIPREYWKRK
jgi:hypothetical protein